MDFIIIIIISLLSPYYSNFLLKTSLLPVSTNYISIVSQALNILQALNPKRIIGGNLMILNIIFIITLMTEQLYDLIPIKCG